MKFVVPAFSGMAPRFADHLLEDVQASDAANLKVVNGDLRGFRGLEKLLSLASPPGGAYRKVKKLYRPGSDEFLWWGHVQALACIINGPLVNDAFDRVYISAPGGGPVVTTWQDLRDNTNVYHPLGVPRPGAPGVVAAPGTDDTRAYVYTYRSAFGEEGMPSDPTIATGAATGAWVINLPSPNLVGFNVTSIDIYRTATGAQSSGDYFRVGTITGGTNFFSDSMPADQVPLQLPLTSDLYDIAPGNLQGLCLHSSGSLAGYADNTVCFAEPYLPHAWPNEYRYTSPYRIVALAAFANAIVVLTSGCPVVLSGNHPGNMSATVLTDIEPCIAPRSVVSIDNSVYYASPNGLMQVSSQGLTRLTNAVLTREEWPRFVTADMVAVKYGSWYVAVIGTSQGFALALPPYEPTSLVRMDRYQDVSSIEIDERNGDAILIQGTKISRFDALSDRRVTTMWRSKEFIAPYPVNMGAIQLLFQGDMRDEHGLALTDAQLAYNAERHVISPLDTLDLYPIGGEASAFELEVPGLPVPAFEELTPPPTQPIGGEPLFLELDPNTVISVRVALMVDGVERYAQLVTDENVRKLPSGYKGTRFYVTVTGNAEVQRIVLAETAKECRNA